jgi:hypothetical protein
MGHEVIDAVKAARLISGYSQEAKANSAILSTEIGGIFHAQDFKKWFENEREVDVEFICQKDNLGSNKVFIEAVYQARDQYITPLNTFGAPELFSEIDVLSFLHRQRKSEESFKVANDRKNMLEAHQQALTALSINRVGKFEINYSRKENLFDVLLHVRKTEVLYIRYFFGLNSTRDKQLSLILAPVDIAGRNILVLPDGTSAPWIELS